jgi:cytidylate kinase
MGDAALVVVVGPTESGKSELGLRIAASFGGEIVNCDSVQLYRHFDIGSAKLPADTRHTASLDRRFGTGRDLLRGGLCAAGQNRAA